MFESLCATSLPGRTPEWAGYPPGWGGVAPRPTRLKGTNMTPDDEGFNGNSKAAKLKRLLDKVTDERNAALEETRRIREEYNRTLNDLTAARNANTALVARNEVLREQLSYYDYQAAVQLGAVLS